MAISGALWVAAGALWWQIERSRASALVLAKDAHDALKPAIRHLLHVAGPVYAVPMPHTSGMAWNRKALDGRRWCDIGKEQVELAVECLELSHAA